jgi:hypothetical protein
MARYKDVQWSLRGNDTDPTVSHDNIQLALLMDIRDELQALNRLFRCSNFLEIPHTLKRISHNTAKPKPKGKSTNETR